MNYGLQAFLASAQHKITGGSEFGWSCWPNARYIDVEAEVYGEKISGSIIHSTVDQTIYQATVEHMYGEGTPYRWTNPTWWGAHEAEAERRGIDTRFAWDEVEYVNVRNLGDLNYILESTFKGDEPRWDIVQTIPQEELYPEEDEAEDDEFKVHDLGEVGEDGRVVISFDLPDEIFIVLAKMAHERDITFNDFVNDVLREAAEAAIAEAEILDEARGLEEGYPYV